VLLYLQSHPKRFKLSPRLSEVLGIEEETRIRIIGALWQYIKSNRLQDKENREVVNCNKELLEIFGEEKLGVHNIVHSLQPHLLEADPIELTFDIAKNQEQQEKWYEMPVDVPSDLCHKYGEFFATCNYDTTQQAEGESKLASLGNQLKKREAKYNSKMTMTMERMKKCYKQMVFYK